MDGTKILVEMGDAQVLERSAYLSELHELELVMVGGGFGDVCI